MIPIRFLKYAVHFQSIQRTFQSCVNDFDSNRHESPAFVTYITTTEHREDDV